MVPRRDLWSLSLLLLGAFGSAAVAFVVQAVLAHTMSVDDFGRFASALAMVSMVAPVVGFGLPAYWLKLYGTEGSRATRWMPASTRFVSISAIGCISVTALWALFAVRDVRTRSFILCMLPVVLSQAAIELNSAKYQLEERHGLLTTWQIAQHIARLVAILCALCFGWSVRTIAIAFGAIGFALLLGACLPLASLHAGRSRICDRAEVSDSLPDASASVRPGVIELCTGAMPFGIANVLYFVYAQSALFVVAHLRNASEVATYSVAITVLNATYLVPAVIFQRLLLPRFHRWATVAPEKLQLARRRGNWQMLVMGIAIAIAVAVMAPTGIPMVFGRRFISAVGLVDVMAVCIPLRFLSISSSSVMTTSNLIHARNACSAAALICGVCAAVTLVPTFGLKGAACAAILGETVWAVSSAVSARRLLPARDVAGVTAGPPVAWSGEGKAQDVVPTTHAPVTVIVPCYNCAATIERAVASIAMQTRVPAELILVDDCSNEETASCLRALQHDYGADWVRIVRQQKNAGPGAARNVAWRTASEPFIAFLDSDDAWHPQKIELQYGWMSRHPDAAITGHPVKQPSSRDAYATEARQSVKWADPQQVSRRQVLFSNRFTPSSVMVRRDVVARFDETKRHAEDYFMLLELVLVEQRAAFLFPFTLSFIFKRQFGAKSGLSAELWKIQKGEQQNYCHFRRAGAIRFYEFVIFSLLSFAKYFRRCLLSGRFA